MRIGLCVVVAGAFLTSCAPANLEGGGAGGGPAARRGARLFFRLVGSQTNAPILPKTRSVWTQDGQVRTKSYADYLIPTVHDVPDEVHPLVLELPDPQGPYGVRGLGEMPMLVLAPAILDAIHDATGIWFDKLPVKAEDVLLALKAQEN